MAGVRALHRARASATDLQALAYVEERLHAEAAGRARQTVAAARTRAEQEAGAAFERLWCVVNNRMLQAFRAARSHSRRWCWPGLRHCTAGELAVAPPKQSQKYRALTSVQEHVADNPVSSRAEILPPLATGEARAQLRRILPSSIDPAWSQEEVRRRFRQPTLELAVRLGDASGSADAAVTNVAGRMALALAAFAPGGALEEQVREALRAQVVVAAALVILLLSAAANLASLTGLVLSGLLRLSLSRLCFLGRAAAFGDVAWLASGVPSLSHDPTTLPGAEALVAVADRAWAPEIGLLVADLLRMQAALTPVFRLIGPE